MRTYYFVKKDGPTLRDRVSLQFPTAAAAVEHGKQWRNGFAAIHGSMTLVSTLVLLMSLVQKFVGGKVDAAQTRIGRLRG